MRLGNEHLEEYEFYLPRDGVPQGWEVVSLNDVSYVVTDGTHKTPKYTAEGVRFISIRNIRPFRPIDWNSYEKYISRKEHNALKKRCHPEYDDVLFPRIGTLGFAKRIDFNEEISIFVGLGLIKPVKAYIFPKYLEYYMNTPYISRLSVKRAKGTGRKTLPLEESRRFPFPLAPFSEQHRIVAKIEELFTELEKGIESLKAARAKLNVYRQAVLKHAFEGKLTAQWREENEGKFETPDQLIARIKKVREVTYQKQLEEWKVAVIELGQNGKKPTKPRGLKKLQPFDIDEIAKLPNLDSDSWKWVKIDEICAHTQYSIKAGPFGSAIKKQYYVSDGYKIYGQEQVISGDPNYGNYYIDSAKYEELKTCKIAPKDVLISLVGTVGKVLVLPDDCSEGIINPRLIKVTLNLDVYRPLFFKYFFESVFVKSLQKNLAKGTTMDVLNLGIIQTLPFPLCSLEEQDKLIAEIESKLSVIDQIETESEAAVEKSENLRKSILKIAFSGKLVVQNPGDEPASMLLERISAEKTKPT